MIEFNQNELEDFIVSHGFGEGTKEGLLLGKQLVLNGDDYSTAAHEVVFRGLTSQDK